MIIKRLKLKNIRSYREEVIEFPLGTVMLAGDVGAGKTTLLLAIEFALFGIKSGELSGEALLRHGASQGSVELDFQIANKHYKIVRTLKRKSGKVRQDRGYLVHNNTRSDMTATELKSFIIELLGYPPELVTTHRSMIYRYTVYTPQEEMKRIITEDSETRLTILRKIFNIDKYKQVKENAELVIRELRRESKLRSSELNKAVQLKARVEQLEKSISELKQKIKLAQRDYEKSEKTLKENEKSFKAKEEQLKKLRELEASFKLKSQLLKTTENEKARLKQQIMNNKMKLNRIKEEYNQIKIPEQKKTLSEVAKERIAKEQLVDQLKKKKNIIETSMAHEIETINTLKQEISRLESQLSQLGEMEKKSEQLEELNRELHKLDGLVKNLNLRISEKKHDLGKCEAQIDENKRILSLLGNRKQCPVCGSKLTEEHRVELLKKLNNELEVISSRKIEITEHLRKLSHELSQADNQQATLKQQQKKLSEEISKLMAGKQLEKEFQLKKEQLSASAKRLKQLENELHALPDILEQEQQLKQLLETEKQLEKLELLKTQKRNLKKQFDELKAETIKLKQEFELLVEKSESIQQELETLNVKLQPKEKIDLEYNTLKRELEAERECNKQALVVLTALKSNLSNMEKELNKTNEELNELEKLRKNIEFNKKLVQWLKDFFIPLMSNIERHVMMAIYNEFNELFVAWFNMLIEVPELQVRLGEDFSPIVIQNGYETPVEHLSGGERTSVALAYRLALNKVINDITSNIKTKNIIILDEPTDGFSSEQLDNVRKIIDELSMKQIIIVSHEPKIESFVEKVLYVTKESGVSKVMYR